MIVSLLNWLAASAGRIEDGERFVHRRKEREMVKAMKPDGLIPWLEQKRELISLNLTG